MGMSATGGIDRTAGAWNAPVCAYRLEKPHESASLGDRDRDPRDRRGAKATRREAYRFDTVCVSPWNGPLLSSPYAAQVIAQTLSAPRPLPPHIAYRAQPVPVALLLDQSL